MSIRTFRSTEEARKAIKLQGIQHIPHKFKRTFHEVSVFGFRKALVITPVFKPRDFAESMFLTERGFAIDYEIS